MKDEKLVLVRAESINGQPFDAGEVVGELRNGAVVSTTAGVTDGNLVARLRREVVVPASRLGEERRAAFPSRVSADEEGSPKSESADGRAETETSQSKSRSRKRK